MTHSFYPSADDEYWNQELEHILAYCDGKGLDIGAGGRSPVEGMTRLDIDLEKHPDIVASGDNIPVKDSEFDYLTAIHALEHFENQDKALKEWARVVKNKGYILIIHPDVDFTKEQKSEKDNPSLAVDKFMKHYHERNLKDFTKWIRTRQYLGFDVVSTGVSLGNWSFYCILRVKKEGVS